MEWSIGPPFEEIRIGGVDEPISIRPFEETTDPDGRTVRRFELPDGQRKRVVVSYYEPGHVPAKVEIFDEGEDGRLRLTGSAVSIPEEEGE